jgi:hypothetical protein
LARILKDRGLYKSPLGTSALCAAAVDDVIAWVLLAGVVGLARSGSMVDAGRTFAATSIGNGRCGGRVGPLHPQRQNCRDATWRDDLLHLLKRV